MTAVLTFQFAELETGNNNNYKKAGSLFRYSWDTKKRFLPLNRSFHTDQFKRGRKETNGGLLQGKDQLFNQVGTKNGDQRMEGRVKYTLGIPVLKAITIFFLKLGFWETVLNWEIARLKGLTT